MICGRKLMVCVGGGDDAVDGDVVQGAHEGK